MSHYSDKPSSVRVDFFRDHDGAASKWYCTDAVEWITYEAPYNKNGNKQESGKMLEDAFVEALWEHLGRADDGGVRRLRGMWAVCLEPYHEHGHPLIIRVPGRTS